MDLVLTVTLLSDHHDPGGDVMAEKDQLLKVGPGECVDGDGIRVGVDDGQEHEMPSSSCERRRN